jgi:glutathione synthase/RimK-type ligase-like ATP-grasp enzyme
MKIAIHKNLQIFQHSSSWEDQWIAHCRTNNIDFEVVDCFQPQVIEKLKEFDILLWHIQNYVLQDMMFARSIIQIASQLGLKVFPDFNTSWHFDDKVAQMFLLESINAPIPNHWFFATKDSCHKWIKSEAKFPVIAKLKCGAGSHNVKMLSSKSQAIRYASKMFGRGCTASPNIFFKASSNYKSAGNLKTIIKRLKRIPDFIQTYSRAKRFQKEKDYCSFQEFIPNIGYDLKVYVIGDKISFLARHTRKGDFRASGGGNLSYDKSLIPRNVLESAFKTSDKLGLQCIGYDYVVDKSTQQGKIIEMSFGFAHQALLDSGGYWDRNYIWHDEPVNAPHEILRNLIK